MREPSSSHLGATWSGALGRVLTLIHQERDRHRAKDSLRPCTHYATFATHRELKRSRLNVVYKCGCKEDEWGKPVFSHDSLAMIKWTVCHYRETVFPSQGMA
jgi:hypothetical protein